MRGGWKRELQGASEPGEAQSSVTARFCVSSHCREGPWAWRSMFPQARNKRRETAVACHDCRRTQTMMMLTQNVQLVCRRIFLLLDPKTRQQRWKILAAKSCHQRRRKRSCVKTNTYLQVRHLVRTLTTWCCVVLAPCHLSRYRAVCGGTALSHSPEEVDDESLTRYYPVAESDLSSSSSTNILYDKRIVNKVSTQCKQQCQRKNIMQIFTLI